MAAVSLLLHWIAETAPDPSSPESLLDFLLRGGSTAVLLVASWLWLTGRIVTRGELEKVERQRDQALAIVYEQFGIARKAVDLSEARLEQEQHFAELLRKEGQP